MIFDVIGSLLGFIAYAFLINFFFSDGLAQFRLTPQAIVTVALLCLAVALNMLFFPQNMVPYANIVVIIALIMTLAAQYAVSFKEAIFLAGIFLATTILSEALVFFFFQNFSIIDPSHHYLFDVVTTSIANVIEMLFVLGMKVLFFKYHAYSQTLTIPLMAALTSIPVISIIVLLSFLITCVQKQIALDAYQILIIFGITYVNLCVLYLYSSLTKHMKKISQISLQNKAMQAEMKYIAEVKKSQSTIRRLRHDLKNRNLVLMGLLDQRKITEAKNYLAQSFDQLAKTSTFYTNDPVLNYLLNEKNALAQANHIDFQIHALISKQISLDNDILSVLIGNLIDNAIEANQRLNVGVSRYINLTIKQFKKDLLIEISNPYDDAKKKTRAHRQTEGLGLKNIKSIIEHYNGLYKQKTSNSTYSVSIMLLNIV